MRRIHGLAEYYRRVNELKELIDYTHDDQIDWSKLKGLPLHNSLGEAEFRFIVYDYGIGYFASIMDEDDLRRALKPAKNRREIVSEQNSADNGDKGQNDLKHLIALFFGAFFGAFVGGLLLQLL